ncbi:Xaa-Pro aminopeptidase [Actinocorallia herbida]|uniref:Xaa-Pro aminopeptidase n=1 Tax=Actinocorallia herbida TaxID=58109 RepID=A0A3N1D0D5_9ACTN|nr:M24 family metallopeptidase [Actinocorallia herbida]ROO86991.1 Xaa-Pro aminopeptidase [Actinocorallia herbida]
MSTWFPTLSLAERDRRWAALRALMADHGLDALVVFGGQRDPLDQYVAGEAGGTVVLTPQDDPVHLLGRFPLQRFDEPGRDRQRWIADFRVGAKLPDVLAERGVTRGAVGVVGLSSRQVGIYAGSIPHSVWQGVLTALPDVTWVDVSAEFEIITVVKSPEERDMIRKSAQLGEDACAAYIAACKPGALESLPVAGAVGAILAGGGSPFRGPYILERSGPSRFAWGQPEWMTMGGAPRTLRRGDTIASEIFAFYGGFETQQQIDVSIGEPAKEFRRLEEIVLESHHAGLGALRAGMSFADLCDIMHEPLTRAKVWNTGPLVQTVSPVIFNGKTHEGTEHDPGLAHLPSLPPVVARDGDFTLVPGVAFAFEANALYEGKRVCLGGTVLLTEDGYEELNTLPNRLVVVDA